MDPQNMPIFCRGFTRVPKAQGRMTAYEWTLRVAIYDTERINNSEQHTYA